MCWVLKGPEYLSRQSRLQAILTMLSENWKIGLVLLIPLFYRTIRGFLERAEKFAGITAPHAPVAQGPSVQNPSPRQQPYAQNTEET